MDKGLIHCGGQYYASKNGVIDLYEAELGLYQLIRAGILRKINLNLI